MYHKVKIKKLPRAKSGYETNSLDKQSLTFGGADANHYKTETEGFRKSLGSVPRSEANLEAEGGETAYGDINGDSLPEHYKIKGPRHAQGGVPMNLPDGTFIFSDYVKLKIKDCNILKMFGKPCGKKKKGYTPAQLAKQYDINKYREILEDVESDSYEKKTAEMMIRKYVVKLGALALAQESMKGYPQGVPVVAQPYLEHMGLSEEDILGPSNETKRQLEEMQQMEQQMAQQQMMSAQQMPQQQGQPMMKSGGSYALGGTPDSCPEGQYYSQITGKCESIENLKKIYHDSAYTARNAKDDVKEFRPIQNVTYSNLMKKAYEDYSKALENKGDYVDAFAEGIYHIGSQSAGSLKRLFGLKNGGGIDNPGFRAFPAEVQNKIVSNMQDGGDFEPHMMYDPQNGIGFMANEYADHVMMNEAGFVHDEPKAMYGMEMSNLNAFIPSNMSGVSISEVAPRMQKGSQKGLPKGAVVLNPDDYDTQEELIAAQREALKKNPDKVFIKREGKLYQVSQKPLAYQGDFATSTFNKKGIAKADEFAGQYQAIVNTFNTPAGKKALQEKAIAALKNKDNVRGLSDAEVKGMIKQLENDPDMAYNQFIDMQQRNLSLAANGIKVAELSNDPDRGDYLNSDFRTAFKDIGVDAPTKEEAAIQQATYIGYSDLIADRNAGKITDPDLNRSLQNFSISQVGLADDELTGTGGDANRISKIDGIYTNTTAGEIAGAEAFELSENEFKIDPEDKEIERTDDGTLLPQIENYEAQWMTPDVLDFTGAVNQPINTYGSWASLYDSPDVRPVFYDPTRAIAAGNEALNMLGQYVDQTTQDATVKRSNLAGAAGKSATLAANTTASYDDKNVPIANQVELLDAQMKADENKINQGVTAQLYRDNNVLLPQAYDTAKAQKKQNIRNAFRQGWQNASNLAGVNALNPNYKINPVTGSVMYIGTDRTATPEKPGLDFEQALAKAQSMGLTDNAAVNAATKLMTETAQRGGYVMGSNVFPFMFY